MREIAALIWGFIFGAVFWSCGAAAITIFSHVLRLEPWWKKPLWIIVLVACGAGGILGLPLLAVVGIWQTADQNPTLCIPLLAGFVAWPGLGVLILWLGRERK